MDRNIPFRYVVQFPQGFTAVIKIFGKRSPFPVPVIVFHKQLSLSLIKQTDEKGMILMSDLFQQIPLPGADYIRDTSAVLK